MIQSSVSQGKCFVGVDVSKKWVDLADLHGRHKRVSNDEASIAALFSGPWAAKECGRVVCEATGGYERPLMRVAQRLALPLCRVHPNRTHAFAGTGSGWHPIWVSLSSGSCWLCKRSSEGLDGHVAALLPMTQGGQSEGARMLRGRD